jgi:hypothetical protein
MIDKTFINDLDRIHKYAALFCSVLASGIVGFIMYKIADDLAFSDLALFAAPGVVFVLSFIAVYCQSTAVLKPFAVQVLVRDEFGIPVSYREARRLAFLFDGSIKFEKGKNKKRSKTIHQYLNDLRKKVKEPVTKNKLFDYANIRAGKILFDRPIRRQLFWEFCIRKTQHWNQQPRPEGRGMKPFVLNQSHPVGVPTVCAQ